MNGQIELSDIIGGEGLQTYKIKPLIYSMSLTCYKTICPYCKMENPDADEPNNCLKRWSRYKGLPYFDKPLDFCPSCGKQFDRDNLDVRKSKEYKEVEALGLHGMVARDEKGNWHEVQL